MRKQIKQEKPLKGRGNVYQGGKIISKVDYIIYRSQEFSDGIPGQKEIKGLITVVDRERNLTNESELTLKLADNQEWKFNIHSGNPIDAVYEVISVPGSDLT
jgi:hypothetical protein